LRKDEFANHFDSLQALIDMEPPKENGRDLGQRLFDFSVRVVRLCQTLDEQPGPARTLARQLLRSGTSIGANYEEAQAGHSRADFIAKAGISLKEARETHYWLRLLAATKVVRGDLIGELIDEADQIKRILGSIVSRSRKNES
jgi:four helix bundle protein